MNDYPLTILESLVILAAQHLNDLCEDCECPRCCLACRAVAGILDLEPQFFPWERILDAFEVEGYWWQTEYGAFAVDQIEAAWHGECPVYATIDANTEEDASANEERDEDGHGELAGGVPAPEVSEA